MEEIVQIIKDLQSRVELLERLVDIKELVIPVDGKLIVDIRAFDPPAEDGRIYYNSVSNKFKVCENGSWKTITTT
jgi:hypothetical protein